MVHYSQTILYYLVFQYFDIERTCWRLFEKLVVETKFNIVNVFTQSHHPVDPSRLSQSLGSPMPINGTHINSLYFTYWAQNRLQVSSWSWSYGTTTYHHYKVVTSTPAHDEVYSLQQYVIMFVFSNLWQVDYSLRIYLFPPPIQLTATI
jgi:hypothetical protein